MYSTSVLVETLVREGHLKSPLIIEAFLKIDRVHFVPKALKARAYENQEISIGFGQILSQPLTAAFMLELLDPQPGERVLEIGAGSGWKTSLLAHVVSSKPPLIKESKRKMKPYDGPGHVVAIERIQKIHEKAVKNISKFGFIEKGIVSLIHGDGSKGYFEKAPFDKIISGAAASSIPFAWKQEVRVGGRIVIPIDDTIKVLDRVSPIKFKVREYSGFKFVPLVTGAGGS